MAKPKHIELGDGTIIPILYEDRSVIAIDKPAGWMLVPHSWDRTSRNLQLALDSSLRAGDFWVRSRSLKYLRFIHRLDAETSGILLLAKSPGALHTFSRLFESRQIEKRYLAIVHELPKQSKWICRLRLAPDPRAIGRMKVDSREGKEAETHFRVLQTGPHTALIEASPVTGRTHQIRVHLAESGHPVKGDSLYGSKELRGSTDKQRSLGLRAVLLAFNDPFTRRAVQISAPFDEFVRAYGFDPALVAGQFKNAVTK